MSGLRVVPCTLRKANDFVAVYNRHSKRTARNGLPDLLESHEALVEALTDAESHLLNQYDTGSGCAADCVRCKVRAALRNAGVQP